jgi:2'-5' RNA ligase
VRLFVAVWPPAEVLDVLDRLPRPDHPAVRWAPRDRWHVTLRFLGDVVEDERPALEQAVAATAAAHPVRRVALGPATVRLSRSVLAVPVAGLDDLGQAINAATAGFGEPPEDRRFTGHLTLARSRSRAVLPAALAGLRVEAGWDVSEVALVRSHLGGGGPRYVTVARFSLPAP